MIGGIGGGGSGGGGGGGGGGGRGESRVVVKNMAEIAVAVRKPPPSSGTFCICARHRDIEEYCDEGCVAERAREKGERGVEVERGKDDFTRDLPHAESYLHGLRGLEVGGGRVPSATDGTPTAFRG
uniref:Uncharacterized protein n=1 Tax=Vespula pensylvanica TaxID=30213 RepID=A0A834UHA6_VESPE|nr:hypothetical protein H0235_002002 [Vespula pensylvanica]